MQTWLPPPRIWRAQFFVRFRRCTGTTPHVYINTLCIEAACRRLAQADDRTSLGRLAEGLSFFDPSHFARFIRGQVGEWRCVEGGGGTSKPDLTHGARSKTKEGSRPVRARHSPASVGPCPTQQQQVPRDCGEGPVRAGCDDPAKKWSGRRSLRSSGMRPSAWGGVCLLAFPGPTS